MSRMWSKRLVVPALFLAFALPSAAVRGEPPTSPGVAVDRMRCEYLASPLGVVSPQPRLSWILTATGRGVRQSAYRVLVASSADLLAQDRGDLWETGKVASDESVHVVYAGRPLASGQGCWWKVRVWDQTDAATAWSAPARWEMGLLRTEDWSGQWITAAVPATAGPFKLLEARYETEDGHTGRDVTPLLAGHVTKDGLVTRVAPGMLGGDPAPKVKKQLRVRYEFDGQAYTETVADQGELHVPNAPLPLLRRPFRIDKPVRQARLFVTALGVYEARINGRRVGDVALAPDWTDYRKRVRYQVYDVTPQVKEGDNALAAIVAPGWFSGHMGWNFYQHYGTTPALLAQLEITHADGTVTRVVTDGSWKLHAGPLLAADLLMGDRYDARREVPGWDQPGLDDHDWLPATVRPESRPVDGQVSEPVRVLREMPAKAVAEPKPGRWTFDLGQNMVGVVRLGVDAPAGTTVVVRHGEMLNPDGTLYTANLRTALATDTYVCRGGGPQTWTPPFTFHGFRYVEVTGLPGPPGVGAVTGIVLGSDTPAAGEFACSDPRVNQLQSNIQWGQRGNFLSVPTDCPQRNERMGWMGDAQVFVRTAAYNADVAAFFTKWLTDVDDAQADNGAFADVSPDPDGHGGTPAWGDAGVICPWTAYQMYDDRRLLEQHYPAMVRWVEYCRARSSGLTRAARPTDFGDWLSIGADTPKDLIATAYFAHSADLVARAADALGRADDARKYHQLFDQIRAAFVAKWVIAAGRVAGDTQTGYLLALRFDLLPDPFRGGAAQRLVDDIVARHDHVSTGFVGVGMMLPTLTAAGRDDVAYRLLLQDTFPSWLFSVRHGATTIWERWDGWTPEKGFQTPDMNSFNHYSLGSCGEWLFESVAEIAADPDHPGFKHFVLAPHPGGGLTFARARYRSVHGDIVSDWSVHDGRFTLAVTVPVNTTATVFLPVGDGATATEGSQPLDGAVGVTAVRRAAGQTVFDVASGSYRFDVAP